MQVTEKQKQQLIDLNDSRVNEILELNPQLNKWYKVSNSKFMVYLTKYVGLNQCEGFYFGADSGEYKGFSDNLGFRYCVLATKQEIEQALIFEAKRRGFKEGVKFKDLHIGKEAIVDEVRYYDDSEDLRAGGYCIFYGGQWAEIIDEKAELKQEIKELEVKLKELREKL